MKMLRPFFPLAFAHKKDIIALVINILVHIVVDAVAGLVIGFLGNLPLIGWAFALVGSVIGVYFLVSLVLSILHYLKIVK
jgi:hypothetical protein